MKMPSISCPVIAARLKKGGRGSGGETTQKKGGAILYCPGEAGIPTLRIPRPNRGPRKVEDREGGQPARKKQDFKFHT